MDENEYRSTYQDVNPIRCVYEKAINSRICNCSHSARFNLADREGVSCDSETSQKVCAELLSILRQKARFTLQLSQAEDRLPHNAEMKIQNGGMYGIAKLINDEDINQSNISLVVSSAIKRYDTISNFPFSEIMRDISAYRARKRRQR